jgi:hypothetical protein
MARLSRETGLRRTARQDAVIPVERRGGGDGQRRVVGQFE